jgi:hypothetical protein
VSLLHLLRSRRLQTPVWEVWSTTATAWNEEEGEVSLSHLGRSVSQDPITDDINHMRDMYLLLGTQLRMSQPGKQKNGRHRRGGKFLDRHSELIWKVAEHFIKSITEITNGTYAVYVAGEENWISASLAVRQAVDDVKVDSWTPVMTFAYLQELVADYSKLVEKSRWVSRVLEEEDKEEATPEGTNGSLLPP